MPSQKASEKHFAMLKRREYKKKYPIPNQSKYREPNRDMIPAESSSSPDTMKGLVRSFPVQWVIGILIILSEIISIVSLKRKSKPA